MADSGEANESVPSTHRDCFQPVRLEKKTAVCFRPKAGRHDGSEVTASPPRKRQVERVKKASKKARYVSILRI